jgi:hypothetical protein
LYFKHEKIDRKIGIDSFFDNFYDNLMITNHALPIAKSIS